MIKVIEKRIDYLITDKKQYKLERPIFEEADYQNRIKKILDLASKDKISHIVIYADREHFSNVEYLTGYDPRFEEAILIVNAQNRPTLVVGNEGWGYADVIPYRINKKLFQSFSLPGQPRDKNLNIKDIFLESGINPKSKIGVIGWKQFYKEDFKDFKHIFEIPHYIVNALAEIVGIVNIINTNKYMIDNAFGLRHCLDEKEIVCHEIAGTKASRKAIQVIRNLQKGITEIEASAFLNIDGEPLSTHPNVNFGSANVLFGLASPTYHQRLEIGDLVSIGLGYRGGLFHRAGIYAKSKMDLNKDLADAMEKYYIPYFQSIIAWYEMVDIGVTGGQVFAAVKKELGNMEAFGVYLNPGHLIHTEEWTNSFFFENNLNCIQSGMAIQCDIIASIKKPKLSMHVEDGIVVADKALREGVRKLAPNSWKRIQRRRKYMKEVLNINISEAILPLSDMQAVFFPYMADTNIVYAKA